MEPRGGDQLDELANVIIRYCDNLIMGFLSVQIRYCFVLHDSRMIPKGMVWPATVFHGIVTCVAHLYAIAICGGYSGVSSLFGKY